MESASTSKSAATVLYELMINLNDKKPEYTFGPQKGQMFDCTCNVMGLSATAVARSRKVAKQIAACMVLQQCAKRGFTVPEIFSVPTKEEGKVLLGEYSYVTMLKEFCEQFRLPNVRYELVQVTGPPYMREYTVRVYVGRVHCIGTASTHQLARQKASEHIYSYLRHFLPEIRPNSEEGTRVRRNEKPLERRKIRSNLGSRPDLGIIATEYHLGFPRCLDDATRDQTYAALALSRSMTPMRGLAVVADSLRLRVEYINNWRNKFKLSVIQLKTGAPDMVFAGTDNTAAAENALKYLRFMLAPSDSEDVEEHVTHCYHPEDPEPTKEPIWELAAEFARDGDHTNNPKPSKCIKSAQDPDCTKAADSKPAQKAPGNTLSSKDQTLATDKASDQNFAIIKNIEYADGQENAKDPKSLVNQEAAAGPPSSQ